MTINTPPRLMPISTAGPRGEAALLVDEAASPEALYLEAESRLSAAKGMLLSAAIASDSAGIEGQDVGNIARAAETLASDALDLMHALNLAHLRATAAARQHAPGTVHHFSRHQGE
nr:hypothetical protein [Halomonas socia]